MGIPTVLEVRVLDVRDASFEARENLLSGIAARLGEDRREFDELKLRVTAWESDAKFAIAMSDVYGRTTTVGAHLKTLSAAKADGWIAARACLAADYSAYAEAVTRLRVLVAAGPIASSALLDARATIDSVEAARYDTRAETGDSIKEKLWISEPAVEALVYRSRSLEGRARSDFAAAVSDMKAGEKRLKASIGAATRSPSLAWAVARARLAADYGIYAEAVGRAELAASGRRSISALRIPASASLADLSK